MLIDSFLPFASPERRTRYQLLNNDASGLSRLVRLGSELHREDDSPSSRAIRFRAGRDFATTRWLCPSCSCRFHMDENWAKAQVAEGKYRNVHICEQLKKHIPFFTRDSPIGSNVSKLAFGYRRISLGSLKRRLILSNKQSRVTLWVRETCPIVRHHPSMII